MIELKNVRYVYSPDEPSCRAALENVTLTVEDGAFYALIGHTGSGKTTLVQLMSGLLKPTGGEIYIDGVNICDKKVKTRDITRKIGVVFQYPEYQLFEDTVFSDVAFGPKNLGCGEEETRERVKNALDTVGISEELYEKSPFELSGGQKRRVAIAGTIAMEPKILVLDEPTAGLDPAGRDEILSEIKKLRSERGMTVIMVSHSMEDITRMATNALVMNHGEAALYGTVDEVFSQGETLVSMGLDVPAVTRIFLSLRERGVPVRTDVYTNEQAASEFLRLVGKGAGA